MQEASPALNSSRVTAELNARGIACRRGDRMLFARLSLHMSAGEAVQITGHNGIGKSSLLRIIAGLAPAFAGSLKTQGDIGLLDEKPALDPTVSLGKALQFWRAIDNAPATTAQHHIQRLGLESLLDVPVRYLSTGQKKRAALARLLTQNAQIWLLDEPLNGLDGQAVSLTQTIAAEHCANGGIALIASHQTFLLPGMRALQLSDYAV